MGDLMRRYWQPFAAVGELDENPTKQVRLLGEDLAAYKDKSGTYGLMELHCPHRRADMTYGILEEHGLRCNYHGWLFDETGACTHMPFEDTAHPEAKFREKVRIAAYPVQAKAGLLWAYMGPLPAPELPRWDILVWPNAVRQIGINTLACNWLQCQENTGDPLHSVWLHGQMFKYALEKSGQWNSRAEDKQTFTVYSRIKMGVGVKHGWLPVGRTFKVTKAEGSVVHEVDGKPAMSIYEDYFGEDEAKKLHTEILAKLAITYPLGIQVPNSTDMLLRAPFRANEDGSIVCDGEIPLGADVQLMVGSREDAIRVARDAAENAKAQLDGSTPKAIIIFNCIARRKLFGERAGDEIAAIQEVLGKDVPLIGFYTYGEQAPLGGEVRNFERCNPVFHNETVVTCVFAE